MSASRRADASPWPADAGALAGIGLNTEF
jgi:hypothetical protein